jgi:6-phosphogluconolactonase (cycloisomerase 2 family)
MKLVSMGALGIAAIIAAGLVTSVSLFGYPKAQSSDQPSEGLNFRVDPLWPKPLPDRWVTGEVAGTCVDSNDHIFIMNRSDLTPKQQKMATPAPPVVELDQEGNVVNSWGDSDALPASRHGCRIDYQGNFWVTGNKDGIVQKYTHDGKLLLQIGIKGQVDTSDGTLTGAAMNSSHTSLFNPADVAIDPSNGDIYVADGYGNRRIVVFDREGHFLRQWGQQGTKAQSDAGVGGVFLMVVHCVVIGNDGLVYVCDRNGDRVQVFDKMGTFKKNILVESKTAQATGIGSVTWVAFSPDPAQKYMYVADGGDEEVRVMDHATGRHLSTFGRPGHQIGQFENLHSVAVDSKGDIITGEAGVVGGGRRVQMFRIVGN